VAAAYIATLSIPESAATASADALRPAPLEIVQLPEFSGVFRGRELTRKDRKLSSGIASVDALIGGGIPRGRISEITGRPGSGRTTLAAAFTAQATRRGETAAWIDAAGALDPESLGEAGVVLGRMLWARLAAYAPHQADSSGGWNYRRRRSGGLSRENLALKAAETVLEAGGFGLVVVDFGERPRAIAPAAALRLARAAERAGAAVIAIAPYRMCGTFAALSVAMRRRRAAFGRIRADSPATFDGIAIEATVARNKLGGSGASAELAAAIDPAAAASATIAIAAPRAEPSPADCLVSLGDRRPLPGGEAQSKGAHAGR
jgi:recA bacterial DNA recombination protein